MTIFAACKGEDPPCRTPRTDPWTRRGDDHLRRLSLQLELERAAEALRCMETCERQSWIASKREEGNRLFRARDFAEACDVYIVAMAALGAGTSTGISDREIEAHRLPLLSNAAACLVELKQWDKARLLCEQVRSLGWPAGCHAALGPRADIAFSQALSLPRAQSSAKILYRAGLACARSGRLQEARSGARSCRSGSPVPTPRFQGL